MKQTARVLCGLILAFCTLTAGARVLDKTLAKANGEAVFLSEFEKNLDAVLEMQKRIVPEAEQTDAWLREQKQAVLSQMIDDKLMLQEAAKRRIRVNKRDLEEGVDKIKSRFSHDPDGKEVDAAVAERLFKEELARENLTEKAFEERVKDQLSVIKLIDQEIQSKIEPPTDEELRAIFDDAARLMNGKEIADRPAEERQQLEALAQYFTEATAERVRARHILKALKEDASMKEKSAARKELQALKKRIDSGADFAELAGSHSDDTESAKRGGDLGFFIKGSMVPSFEKAAFALNVGEVSDIVTTQFGLHLIMVDAKTAKQSLRFDDVRDQLHQFVIRQKAKKRFDFWIEALRAQATIEILDDQLK